MKVLVVSGFLGAGKTTFITVMSQRCRQKFVVMENEMGAVGVDGGLLSSTLGKNIDIYELTEGCICCSMKSDFASSVLTIANSLDPECLLVEPTGVGMLSRIMDNLRKIAYERIQLLAPVTIVDTLNCHVSERDFPDIFADQIASSGTIVFSKAENISIEERSAIKTMVRRYTPRAEIVANPYAEQSCEWWDKLWFKGLDGNLLNSEPAPVVNPNLDMCSLTETFLPSISYLVVFLEDLLHGKYGGIVRAKGSILAGKEVLRFDLAGGQYCVTGMDKQNDVDSKTLLPQAVFIGKNLDKQALQAALRDSSQKIHA